MVAHRLASSFLGLLALYLFLASGSPIYAGFPDSTFQAAAVGKLYNGILSEERLHLYQADFFPLTLAERGRMATSAYRGMPPGFYGYSFNGRRLWNPLAGFWKEQWIPQQRISSRAAAGAVPTLKLRSSPPASLKPVTDVTFFQNFTTGLSYLDIDFSARLNKTDFFRLSGNNFLRDGTLPFQQSRIQVNTYQTQFHFQLNSRWQSDIRYWQMRHRFNLPPTNIFSFQKDKFKQVAHLFWIRLKGAFSGGDSLLITPEYNKWADEFWAEGVFSRKIDLHWGGGKVAYFHDLFSGQLKLSSQAFRVSQQGRFFWNNHSEWSLRSALAYYYRGRKWRFRGTAGVFRNSDIGSIGTGNLSLEWLPSDKGDFMVEFSRSASAPPLIWRTLNGDSLPPVNTRSFFDKQGITISASHSFSSHLWIRIQGFSFRHRNYFLYREADNRWQKYYFRNRGVNVRTHLKIWRFTVLNDYTYNLNYRDVLAPEFANVTTITSELTMFKSALRWEGTFVARLQGEYRRPLFNRFLYNYQPGTRSVRPLAITDFILRAHIKNAILFFAFENILSTDYEFVEGFPEFFRFFRFGVYWRLFD